MCIRDRMKTGEAVYQARKDTARLFGIKDPARLIFTKNTTESLNMAMSGFLQEGDHVVTPSMEHNSVCLLYTSRGRKLSEHPVPSAGILCGSVSVQPYRTVKGRHTDLPKADGRILLRKFDRAGLRSGNGKMCIRDRYSSARPIQHG